MFSEWEAIELKVLVYAKLTSWFVLQNVKLLQQFISPHTGQVYDPTRTGELQIYKRVMSVLFKAYDIMLILWVCVCVCVTGVCMKQHKKLNQAIDMAKDHGN